MVRNYKRKTEDRWSKEDLLEALICIKEAKLKINDAARQYGISRATLYRQYQKFILAGGKCDVNQFRTCGGNPILTKVEEDVLEKTIRDLREQGFTVTSSDIKRICFEYCDSNGIPNQFNQEKRMASDDWYYGFLKRHPDVRIPKPGGSSQKSLPLPGSATGGAGDIDDILTSADKMVKSKKSKGSPGKKLLKHDRTTPSKSPVHIIPTLTAPSEVTADQRANHNFHEHAPILIPHDADARKLKKPLKRLSGKSGSKSRGRKPTSSASLHTIPIQMEDEYVKAEVDDADDNEDGEDQMLEHDQDQDEVMETEEADEEEEDEEEDEEEEEDDEDEDVADEPIVDQGDDGEDQDEDAEDVEMVDEDEEEQDEAEKSESEEEEEAEGEEEDADGDDDEEVEEAEGGEDQEEVDEDAEADNDAEEGDAEEGEEDEDEDEEEEEEDEDENDDDDNGDSRALTAENDESGSDVDCTNEDLLDKLLDNI